MILIGHRGARFEAPENTVSGFRYAVALGLRAVEFDLHLTRDEAVAIIHDGTVNRTTNGTGDVAGLTMAELQALDARSTFPDWPEQCPVPTLAEVLDVVQGLDRLEIEVKTDDPARMRRVIELAAAEFVRRGIAGRVTLTSFEPQALELAREIAPDIRRGLLGAAESPAFVDTAVALGCSRIGARITATNPDVLSRARSFGLAVVGWPVNTAEDIRIAQSLGIDLVTTDAPSLIRALLAIPSDGASGSR